MASMLTDACHAFPERRLGRFALALAAASLLASSSGCGSWYALQAAQGQWQIIRARQPLEVVLADPRTPPQLKATLEEVRGAREFASRELHLPDNRSYRSYADIGREYVVWNVVAAPEFSVKPRRWCFPVAGCVAYRGYFKERRARRFARALAARGFDVAIDGVPAYSTLGKFADPVLSSMLRYGDTEVVATIFHELAHQLLYVAGDSEFNEAFAMTVENEGVARWLTAQGRPERIEQFRSANARERDYVRLFERTRERLARLYASGAPAAELRAGKRRELDMLAADILALEQAQRLTGTLYDRWIQEGLNNARLVSIATYFDCMPGFERLLADSDGDLARFYAAARELSKRPRRDRHAQLCTGAGRN